MRRAVRRDFQQQVPQWPLLSRIGQRILTGRCGQPFRRATSASSEAPSVRHPVNDSGVVSWSYIVGNAAHRAFSGPGSAE